MTIQLRTLAAVLASCLLLALHLSAQSAQSDDANPQRFEVASIKRNIDGNFAGSRGFLPSGEVRLNNVPVQALVLMAYPVDLYPPNVVGLPSWATESERYDLVAKGKAGASIAERQQMMRTLLAERMKLVAHYEFRDKSTYDLLRARRDGSLGDGLKPSTLDCAHPATPAPPAPDADPKTVVQSRCNSFGFDGTGTTYAGGITMALLVRLLGTTAGRPVVDKTGLDGFYSVTLRYQRLPPRPDSAPAPDDPPSVFTAVQEQLGLKLEPSKTQVQVLVIDHIERPNPD